jgi:hypothetical protein
MQAMGNAVVTLLRSGERPAVAQSGAFARSERTGLKASVGRSIRVRAEKRETKAEDFRSTGIQCRCGELLGEVIEYDLVKVVHRAKNEVSEVRPQIVPQCPLAC